MVDMNKKQLTRIRSSARKGLSNRVLPTAFDIVVILRFNRLNDHLDGFYFAIHIKSVFSMEWREAIASIIASIAALASILSASGSVPSGLT